MTFVNWIGLIEIENYENCSICLCSDNLIHEMVLIQKVQIAH